MAVKVPAGKTLRDSLLVDRIRDDSLVILKDISGGSEDGYTFYFRLKPEAEVWISATARRKVGSFYSPTLQEGQTIGIYYDTLEKDFFHKVSHIVIQDADVRKTESDTVPVASLMKLLPREVILRNVPTDALVEELHRRTKS
jgi:hypothetical protein